MFFSIVTLAHIDPGDTGFPAVSELQPCVMKKNVMECLGIPGLGWIPTS